MRDAPHIFDSLCQEIAELINSGKVKQADIVNKDAKFTD